MRSEVIKATFIVALIWWAIFTAYAFFGDPGSFILGKRHFFTSWRAILMGILIGGGGAAAFIFLNRQNRKLLLQPEVKRGLSISIGDVPEQAGTPLRSKVMPDLTGTPSIRRWLGWLEKSSPEHVVLAKAIIRTFWNDPNLPATHVKNGHGGKTLFEHTVLVCEQMLFLSQNWEYKGLRGKSGALVLALRDTNYRFDRTDPLIGLVALAHDLGKIECYIMEDGNIVGSRHDHDRVSSQMLARMPEFWNLPHEDRSALLGAVGYYHHPQDLPLDQDGRAADDRSIALLELLIRADHAAGDIEGGRAPFVAPSQSSAGSFSQPSSGGSQDSDGGGIVPRENISEEQLWNAFVELVKEPGRVNGRNAKLSIGQKRDELVYFKEQALRVEMVKRLGISDMHRYGDGRYAFTEDLLEVLIDKNVLYNWHEGQEYSKHRALFRVSFFNAENAGHLATWPAVVIVKPGASIPFLSSLPDHPANPKIERPVYSDNSAKNKNRKGEEADADEAAVPVSSGDGTSDIDPFASGPIMDDPSDNAPVDAVGSLGETGEDALAEMSPDIEAIERERKESELAIQEKKEERVSRAADARLPPTILGKLNELDEVAPAEEFGRKPPARNPGTRILAEIASVMEAYSSERIKPIGEKEGVVWFRLSVLEAAAPGLYWPGEAEKEHGLVKIKDLGGTIAIGLIKPF